MNSNSFMNYRQKNEDQTFSPYHNPACLTFNQTTIILSGEEFYNIHGMQRFISPFFKKTDRPPCHITLCCLSHTSLKNAYHTLGNPRLNLHPDNISKTL